jgi:hypothetical protein
MGLARKAVSSSTVSRSTGPDGRCETDAHKDVLISCTALQQVAQNLKPSEEEQEVAEEGALQQIHGIAAAFIRRKGEKGGNGGTPLPHYPS